MVQVGKKWNGGRDVTRRSVHRAASVKGQLSGCLHYAKQASRCKGGRWKRTDEVIQTVRVLYCEALRLWETRVVER